jgi:two-component system, NarL family, response regulator NreC
VSPHPQIHGEGIFAGDKKPGRVSGRIRCILVHNHVLVRQGLRRLLEDEAELEVVAEAGNSAEALRSVFESQPDIVLTDAATMEMPADDAERLILREAPASRVLFLGHEEESDSSRSEAVAQNDSSRVPRHTSAEELVALVKELTDRTKRVHVVPDNRDREWFPVDAVPSKKRGLTSREREVLKLLAEGQTVRSAAGVLGVSAKTVDAHKFNLMRKLGIHNKAELVMWAIQQRVVKVPVNL